MMVFSRLIDIDIKTALIILLGFAGIISLACEKIQFFCRKKIFKEKEEGGEV